MGGGISTSAENPDYLLDNADPRSERRFDALGQLFDARTIEYLAALGVAPGWLCWEVGAGGGSVAEWLAGAVGTDRLGAGYRSRPAAAVDRGGRVGGDASRRRARRDPEWCL